LFALACTFLGGARAAAATITRNGSPFRATLAELSADSHDKSDLAQGHPRPSPSSRHYMPICWNGWFLGPVLSEFSAPPDPASRVQLPAGRQNPRHRLDDTGRGDPRPPTGFSNRIRRRGVRLPGCAAFESQPSKRLPTRCTSSPTRIPNTPGSPPARPDRPSGSRPSGGSNPVGRAFVTPLFGLRPSRHRLRAGVTV
jgi:hypothetical protein